MPSSTQSIPWGLQAAHDAGEVNDGISITDGGVADVLAKGVIDPPRVKTQTLASAQKAAVLILRIDDMIAAGDLGEADEEDFVSNVDMDF